MRTNCVSRAAFLFTGPRRGRRPAIALGLLAAVVAAAVPMAARGDSVNSPNITLNVDTNRAVGAGAGGVSLAINTITIAETTLGEYSAGAGSAIVLRARPGYQFDPTSAVSTVSATIGFNGAAINTAAILTPSGAAEEALTFALTSGTGASQDIIRINGVRVRILSAAGAAGPAQTTLSITTSGAGGAFTDQGIVAANITVGAADRLVFSAEPGSTQIGGDLLPAVKIVDFGGNLVTGDMRLITLAIQQNPGGTTLMGINGLETDSGVATWIPEDNLRIEEVGEGYTLRASHAGPNFLSSDTVDSAPFNITAGDADRLVFTLQPVDTTAGGDILVSVTVLDADDNVVTSPPFNITLDSAVNPGGWPLLVDSSLTKATVAGVATWDATDDLRINRAVGGYRLLASGVGEPVESATFDVAAGAPAALEFVGQPSAAQTGVAIAPPVTVIVVDEFSNRTTSTATVELALRSTCGGTLAGGSATAEAGIAVFEALTIDTPCDDVRLEASAEPLPGTISEAFVVSSLPPATLRFVQQPTTVGRGAAFNPPVTVEIVDAAGVRTDTAATVTMTLSSACGGTVSSASAEAVAGLATFAGLAASTPCTDVTLQATADGLTAATSEAFDVVELPPAALRFRQQPTNVGRGLAFDPPVTIEIVDAAGSRTDSDATVELMLFSTCGGSLSLASAEAVDGVATFAPLSIDTACDGVTLRASAAGLTSTTSVPFDVDALPPAALGFVRQPTTVRQGAAFNPPVSVEIVDAAGGRTGSNAVVELALVSSCGGALSTDSVRAVGGLATFAMLSIDTPCTAITLQATSAGLTGATSDEFRVDQAVAAARPPCGQGTAPAMVMVLAGLMGFVGVRRK